MSMSRSWFVLGSGIAAAQPTASESRALLIENIMLCEPAFGTGHKGAGIVSGNALDKGQDDEGCDDHTTCRPMHLLSGPLRQPLRKDRIAHFDRVQEEDDMLRVPLLCALRPLILEVAVLAD